LLRRRRARAFKNSSTCGASGAPPLRMSVTRPPRRALIFEKTSRSKKGAACTAGPSSLRLGASPS